MKKSKGLLIQKNIREKLEYEHDKFRRERYPGLPYVREAFNNNAIITKVFDEPKNHYIVSKYENKKYIHILQ
jgi:hypothetical protein